MTGAARGYHVQCCLHRRQLCLTNLLTPDAVAHVVEHPGLGFRARAVSVGTAPYRGDIRRVKKTVVLYGLLGGVLIAGLKFVEYRFLVLEHSLEIYGGIVALLFSVVGIWLGLKLTKTKETIVVKEVTVPVPVAGPFAVNSARQQALGITARELEILEHIAAGLSNREIAEKLFVSENTVKTHSSRLFDKLDAKRRTQAVQRGKEAGLIP